MKYACFECGAEYTERVSYCSGCGNFSTMLPVPEGGKTFWQVRRRGIVTAKALAASAQWGRTVREFEFLGKLPDEWTILLYGNPGGGKSTMALRFCVGTGEKVLYASVEEGLGATMVKRLVDWEVRTEDVLVSDVRTVRELRQDVDQYQPDVVVIDSVSALGSVLDHPKAIWIAQTTKQGEFRGTQEVAHLADVVCRVMRNGSEHVAVVEKTRFGSCGEYPI